MILTNSGASSAPVHLEPVPASGSVTVKLQRTDLDIPAGASVAVAFTTTRENEGIGQDVPIRFVATYAALDGTPEVAIAGLLVKAVPGPALVQARIVSNVTSINENRPGEGWLVITNPHDTYMQLLKFEIFAPDAVDVALACPGSPSMHVPAGQNLLSTKCTLQVNPQSELWLRLDLQTGNSVTPGPRTLVIRTSAIDPDTASTSSSTATLAFTVDVFAESDILKTVGVPIFLLLPGVVIVVTLWSLLTRLPPWSSALAGRSAIDLPATASLGSIFGLLASLTFARLYPWLTLTIWPHESRDYLRAYGFRDFYYVAGYSLAIALLLWLAACAVFFLVWKIYIAGPNADDSPQNLLTKLTLGALPRFDSRLPRIRIDGVGGGLRMSNYMGKDWIVPAVQVSVEDQAPAKLAARIESLAARGSSLGLWWTVFSALRAKQVTLGFRAADVAAPTLIADDAKVQTRGQQGMAVELAPR